MTSAPGPRPPTVLLVEDDLGIREVIADALLLDGLEVVSAGGASEALRALDSGCRPSVVLLDLLMPGTSGERLLPLLRGHPATSAARIVVMSASPERLARIEGADARLAKPFDLEDLLAAIVRLREAADPRPPVLGIATMDADHRAQLDLALALAQALRGARPVHEAARLLAELTDQTHAHFSGEAELMQRRAYPGAAAHLGDHSRQLRELERWRRAGAAGTAMTAADADALRSSLADHIATMDRELARYLGDEDGPGRDGGPPP